jgi:hypothetical protein
LIFTAASLFNATTEVRDRFWMNDMVSIAAVRHQRLKNFGRHPKATAIIPNGDIRMKVPPTPRRAAFKAT